MAVAPAAQPDPVAAALTPPAPPAPAPTVTGFTTGPIMEGQDQGNAAAPSTAMQGFEVSPEMRQAGLEYQEAPYLPSPAQGRGPGPQPPAVPSVTLDPGQANLHYGVDGVLHFDAPVAQPVAALMQQAALDKAKRQEIAAREPGGVWEASKRLGVSFLGSSLDPTNIAIGFIPGLGEARYGEWLAEAGVRGVAGRTAARLAAGAGTGALATAVTLPLEYQAMQREGDDMSMSDALLQIAYGGAGFGLFHAASGLVGDIFHGAPTGVARPAAADAIATADTTTHETALRTALAQMDDGRPVEVSPMFGSQEGPGYRMQSLPVFNPADFGTLAEETRLREIDATLAAQQASLAPGDQAAADTLARLGEVERQLADPALSPEARKTLSTRRDELLTDTNPETLRAQAAPIEQARALEAQRAAIARRLDEISTERAGQAAETALSSVPKPEAPLPRGVEAGLQAMASAKSEALNGVGAAVRDGLRGHIPDASAGAMAHALSLAHAAEEGGQTVRELIGGKEHFDSNVPAETEAFLRLLYHGKDMEKLRPTSTIRAAIAKFVEVRNAQEQATRQALEESIRTGQLPADTSGIGGGAERGGEPGQRSVGDGGVQSIVGQGSRAGAGRSAANDSAPASLAAALRAAAGEALPEELALNRVADAAAKDPMAKLPEPSQPSSGTALPKPLADATAIAEASVRQAQAEGLLTPDELKAIEASDAEVKAAEQQGKLFQAAAACLGRVA